ncbi:MAG: FAD-dependent oxidoreductase [candidate division KSB1 bacterium]|nr:FAD-dependent oxidoreductase [candidate division KSB1 bacterium]
MSEPTPNRQGTVLVCGAGITGIQTALDLANAGARVYLLESNPTIGGILAQLERSAINDWPALCQLAPLIADLQRHPNIELITYADLLNVKKKDNLFEVSIRKNPYRVNERCNDCGACVQVCPIKPLSTFNEGLSLRTAIDIQHKGFFSTCYNIEKETPICQETCPVHIDIRKYIGLIADGRYLDALAVIRERNPLPAICGRVCNHPCEGACNRGKQDEAVAIDALKRFVADYELQLKKQGKIPKPVAPPVNEKLGKVAVVGSGPAGLTVAHDLALKGIRSTIFEAAPVPGGMLWLAIPEYRLPRDIIQTEVDYICDLGVELKLNTPINKQYTIDDLLKDGYRAVFLGIGAHQGLKLGVPGEDDYEGFLDCIVFLRRVNLGDTTKPGRKVIVIGGGNSAIDAARTALRLGSDEVHIVYRRTVKEMPANPWEIEEAEKEGVKITYLAAPVQILGENGKVVGMRCTRMKLGKLDASGRRSPVPIKGSEFDIEADVIVPAISQQPDVSFLHDGHGLSINKWNSFDVNSRTMQTNRPEIFAGGDAVTGPATVIQAIAAGHQAASSIEKFLKGELK